MPSSPNSILKAIRKLMANNTPENARALAEAAGLRIEKPLQPIKNSAGEVSTSNGLELKIAIQDKWKSAGIKSLSNINFMVDPVVGEALTADTSIGRPIKIQLSDKPELKALWENYSAIKADSDAQSQKAIQAKKDAARAAAKAEAIEKGKNLADEMGKADNMEQQKQVQNVVIQAMGFTPGFDTYGKAMLPDVAGYKPYAVYTNQRNVENRSTLRMFGGTDSVHQQMIESQYKR